MIATFDAIARGWTPLFDQAIIATNALDSLVFEPRLVGVYSDASIGGAPPVYGIGPLFVWLIAPAARFTEGWGLPLTIGVLNAAAAFAAVLLAKRLGGWILCVATALAITTMLASLPAGTVYDPINSAGALLPFTCLLFIAWAVACGVFRLLPVLVLVSSFVLQAHFSVGLAALGCVAVALIGLGIRVGRCWLGDGEAARRSAGRWALGAAVVGVVCWAPAVLDEVLHEPGNLTKLKDTALTSEENLGTEAGWETWVRAVGVRPWWLRGDVGQQGRLTELLSDPSATSQATAVLALVALAVAFASGVYLREPNLAIPAALALVLAVALFITISATPTRLGLAFEKVTRWTLPAGMFVWLTLLHVVVTGAKAARPVSVRAMRVPRTVVVGAAVAILAGAVVVSTSKTTRQTGQLRHANAAKTMVRRILDNVDRGARVLVQQNNTPQAAGLGFEMQTAIVYGLRKHAYSVRVPQGVFALADKLGDRYRLRNTRPNTLVTVTDARPEARMGRVVSRVRLLLDPTVPGSQPVVLTTTVRDL